MNGGFKCVECGFEDVDDEDDICDECALRYQDDEDDDDEETLKCC